MRLLRERRVIRRVCFEICRFGEMEISGMGLALMRIGT